jgi:hypothetical protein
MAQRLEGFCWAETEAAGTSRETSRGMYICRESFRILSNITQQHVVICSSYIYLLFRLMCEIYLDVY